MDLKWISLLGEFDVQKDQITFLGKTIQYQDQPSPAIGNILCNQRFGGGTIEATITFDEVRERTAAELILSYDPQARSLLLAGLGGVGWAMFDIRDFRPGGADLPWTNHAATGSRENLKPNTPYKIKASIFGSVVSLHVDDVHVITTTLPYSLQETQVGIWCMGEHSIRITDFTVTPATPKAFIVMQFSSPFNEIYSDVIKKVCENNGLDAVRADEICGPGLIIGDVVQEILRAKVIIADITPQNANVFFEVGYAFALNKPTILLAEKPTQLPFDLSAFRVLFYENSIAGKAKVEQALEKHLKSIMGAA